MPEGVSAASTPRFADGTPAHGFPRLPDGTPARGVPGPADGTPARGVPQFGPGTPPGGVPQFAHGDGTPAHGFPHVRGGHPEQHEDGGGWGQFGGSGVGVAQGARRDVAQEQARRIPPRDRRNGPRQDYIDAFGNDDVALTGAATAMRTDAYASRTGRTLESPSADDQVGRGSERRRKGRTYTGIAAAAITTVLAVVVAGQVTDGSDGSDGSDDETVTQPQSASGERGVTGAGGSADRSDGRPEPSNSPARLVTLTYGQKMAKKYPLAADLTGSGAFEAVGGFDPAPGRGQKFRYRVDVEEGLGLDAELFAQAVQKTLNDNRSWAHNGARTFERISSGKPDFVITLASPGTTAFWCAKSELDTTQDNVSCDSALTDRVMINAYRWAQGSQTYGDAMLAYRQMLINHEVGHRLGYGHETCNKDGALAPVMQQQTKFLDHDGIRCRPNPWAFPGN
ncbi:DUF3152 domain-containing protein [Streptomyces cavernae]|uniref:DUF3152 domain-containing protein n=1 Tax=Streptomyces cavernae TaxID=2259034 RepID=UPI001EE4516D|nr:DUF3152 domain-containing protein [Streptomyces cavernae]